MNRLRNHTGSLLLITLGIVTILSVLAVAIARYLSMDVRLMRYRLAREQAKVLARSGVYLTIHRLKTDANNADWLQDDWASLKLDGISVETRDEERALNLKRIGDVKTQFETALGNIQDVERLIDYQDTDSTALSPLSLEQSDTPPYYAKNRPSVRLEEVADIPGISEELVSQLKKIASVFLESTVKAVNINTAPAEVLQALGLAGSAIDAWIPLQQQGRYFVDLANLTVDDNSIPPPLLVSDQAFDNARRNNDIGITSQTFRVVSEGVSGQPAVRYRVETVVQRKAATGTSSLSVPLLAWSELL